MANLTQTLHLLEIQAGGPGSGRHALVGSRSGVIGKNMTKEEAKEKKIQTKAQNNFGRAGGIWKGTDSPEVLKIMKHDEGESDASIKTRFWGQ